MSLPNPSPTLPDDDVREDEGRGAGKRRVRREERRDAAALAWWGRPGLLVFCLAVALAGAGWWLLVDTGRKIPVRQATIDDLHLRLEEARWILDQMDHGENFQKPSVMMPDMPDWGKQRVTVDLSFFNRSSDGKIYDGEEFYLVPEFGEAVSPVGAQVGRAKLGPGQALNTALHFDFDTRIPHGKLRMEWRRSGSSVYLPIPEPAEHYHLRPRGGEVNFPPDARLVMPLGKADRGRALFVGVYGCVACHGDPQIPGSNNVGPHLAGVASVAGQRVEGVTAAQYLYESIVDPGAAIAPECKDGRPCREPTAMPEYASLMSLQDVADVLLYVTTLRQETTTGS